MRQMCVITAVWIIDWRISSRTFLLQLSCWASPPLHCASLWPRAGLLAAATFSAEITVTLCHVLFTSRLKILTLWNIRHWVSMWICVCRYSRIQCVIMKMHAIIMHYLNCFYEYSDCWFSLFTAPNTWKINRLFIFQHKHFSLISWGM